MDKVGGIFIFAIILYGIFSLIAGSIGLVDQFGSVWGMIAIVAGLFFRTGLPFMIGVFFFGTNSLEWHWVLAVLLASPNLVLLIPAMVMEIFVRSRR